MSFFKNRAHFYFNNIIKLEDFDFDNVLFNEKSYENILIYDVLCKTLIGTKTLHIMFDKVDGFIRDYDLSKYLVLSTLEKHNAIYDRIRYLLGLKSNIKYVFSHNYAKIKIGSDDDLPLRKTLTMHNVTIASNLVLDEDQNQY